MRIALPGGRFRRIAPVAVLALLLLALSVVFAQPEDSGLPLDPYSTSGGGTKALRLVLEGVGAEVDVHDRLPAEMPDVFLVLADNLDSASAQRLRAFARGGGVLVVTDHGNIAGDDIRELGPVSGGLLDAVLPRRCEVPALRHALEVRVGSGSGLEVPRGATGCYRGNQTNWLVVVPMGAGVLVTTGGPSFLTNALLGEADNAQLAVALLAPRPGTRVGILNPDFFADRAGNDEQGLLDLIPLPLRLAALQLLIAFLFVVLWRARRLGKPVFEPQEVRLPGSELVIAVGNLLHRTGARDRAVELLRADLRRSLAQSLGVEQDSDPVRLADAAAARTSATQADVLDVLAGPVPTTDVGFVELSQRAEALRQSVLVPVTSGAARADHE